MHLKRNINDIPTHRFQFRDVPSEILGDIHHLIDNAVHLLEKRDNNIKPVATLDKVLSNRSISIR